MRLLIFSPFYPPHIGGLETHAFEFNQHLAPSVESIIIFTPQLPASASVRETVGNITIFRFPAFEAIHNYPLPRFWCTDFWQLWQEALAKSPTHIVSRTRFFFTSLMAWRIAQSKSLPWLHIEHGSDYAQFNGSFKTSLGKLYDWTIGRLILRHADSVVANSQASASFVQKLSGRDDARVIYRGANIEAIEKCVPNQEIAEKYQGKTIIAFIGRLIDGKGAHDLITALAQLQRNDIVTLIIGGGPEEARLKKMTAEYHLNNQVVFFGNLPFEKAISILKTTHIVVNPSYTEGLPTSVTESGLCHKAIIATNVGGTPEVITGNNDGFLVPPRQPMLIAEKLALLIENPALRATLSENAFVTVQDKFSWPRAIEQYQEIFRGIPKKNQ